MRGYFGDTQGLANLARFVDAPEQQVFVCAEDLRRECVAGVAVYELHVVFFFSSRRRHTRCLSDWSSDVCSSDLVKGRAVTHLVFGGKRGKWLVPFGSDRLREHLSTLKRKQNAAAGERVDEGRGRSEERRVGKECRSRWWANHYKKQKQ